MNSVKSLFTAGRKRLWTKGEESGHFLILKNIRLDCDQDSLLIQASPTGPVCHTGADTCWDEKNEGGDFLNDLRLIILDRKNHRKRTLIFPDCLKRESTRLPRK